MEIATALTELAKLDSDIKSALSTYGFPPPRCLPQGFETLAKIVVGQQISRAAASAIWTKLETAQCITSAQIDARSLPELRALGLSSQKATYLKILAEAECSGDLCFADLAHMAGETLQKTLTKYKGIGNWTADNYRLFALGDMDAWPGNDLALQEAMKRLKRLNERPSGKQMEILAKNWAPYRGAGALFLWHLYAIEVRGALPADI